MRLVVAWLVLAQGLIGMPATAWAGLPAETPAPGVAVQRAGPPVLPPTSRPVFSDPPTAAEIGRVRVFAEPLVPVGGPPTAAENRALVRLLAAYRADPALDVAGAIDRFLATYPGSPWRASLRGNAGTWLRQWGFFSRAVAAWDEAWRLAADAPDARGRGVAAHALGETLAFQTTLGHRDGLARSLARIGDRDLGGTAGARVAEARQVLRWLRAHPARVIPSGPTALAVLLATLRGPAAAGVDTLRRAPARAAGTALAEVQALAAQVGLPVRAVVRPPGAALPVPAVVHLSLGHFTAVVQARGDRYLVRDPALGGPVWMAAAALDEELSGFVLMPGDAVPAGWRAATDEEAAAVVGHSCPPGRPDPNEPCPEGCCATGGAPGRGGSGPACSGSCAPSGGLATYTFSPVSASLLLTDTPVGYAPPRGPAVFGTVRYDYRQTLQPQMPTFSHLGPRWTFAWLAYAEEVPISIPQGGGSGYLPDHVSVHLRGGGQEVFTGPEASGAYPRHWRTRAQLVRVSADPIQYERRLPDGTVEVYGLADAAPAGSRRVFLTAVRDAHGQAVALTYDSQFRLMALTDALGQVTTLGYAHASDPLRITSITDPFGRTATFTYTAAGQLATITDVVGMTSTFRYGVNDFVTALTTPYGTTTFRHETDGDSAWNPVIEATDPMGGTERLQFETLSATLAATAPTAEVPAGFASRNAALNQFNTLYWDQTAWATAPGDPAAATVTHWLLSAWAAEAQALSVQVPHSVQRPGVRRVWYAYPGQGTSGSALTQVGTWRQPATTARVLPDGTTQAASVTYNDLGHVTSRIDPVGRTTTYTYAANGRDLLDVRQGTGAGDLLATYGNYTASGQPQTITDAAGQTTTLTYTAAGQVLTITNARTETTTYAYDANGYLASVTGPVAGAMTSYTYDGYGRVRTVTTDGVTVTTDYEALDRVTRVTYPDETFEETTYDRLDVGTRRDRLGRVTRYWYDGARRLVATRDPAGRVIRQAYGAGWSRLIDANGHATTLESNLAGRVTREVRADGLTATAYAYDAVGRLVTMTDPKQQVGTYTYAADDAVTGAAWTNAAVATPGVSYAYDAAYPRVTSMTDGTGVTGYTYHPTGQLGAGQVASVDGPLPDDTITYGYDQLGRVASRAINGVPLSLTYDALGRVTQEANALGTFGYGYDGASGRLTNVTYPNGQTSAYSYFSTTQDHRLQTIHHQLPGGATLGRHDYTYDGVGNILTWRQQGDADAALWRYGYDRVDQLTRAVTESTDPTPQVLQRFAYGYDPAGNRLVEQVDDTVRSWTYDALNRLATQAGGGVLQFVGTVNEPATVTVAGQPASVSSANAFEVGVPVSVGTNTVAVTATDPSGNTATATYEVDVAQNATTFTYDATGNLTSDGTRTLEWDARNQLVAVAVGTHRSEFVYDGLQRRVRQVEKESGVTTSDTRVLWCETSICEERAADGVTVTRRLFDQGEQTDAAARVFTTDHLGTVHEVTDSAGGLLGRYAFDAWGRRTVTGADVARMGFARQAAHSVSELSLAWYRVYDANLGRWLSDDPSGTAGGINLTLYGANNPVRLFDPIGLWPWDPLLCFYHAKKCIDSALLCKARLEPRINDICIVRNLSGPSAANWQICYVENPDCAKYIKHCIKTAVTPMGGTPAKPGS